MSGVPIGRTLGRFTPSSTILSETRPPPMLVQSVTRSHKLKIHVGVRPTCGSLAEAILLLCWDRLCHGVVIAQSHSCDIATGTNRQCHGIVNRPARFLPPARLRYSVAVQQCIPRSYPVSTVRRSLNPPKPRLNAVSNSCARHVSGRETRDKHVIWSSYFHSDTTSYPIHEIRSIANGNRSCVLARELSILGETNSFQAKQILPR